MVDGEKLKAVLQTVIKTKTNEIELLKSIEPDLLMKTLEKLKSISKTDSLEEALGYRVYLNFDERKMLEVVEKLIEIEASGLNNFSISIRDVYANLGKENKPKPPKPYKDIFFSLIFLI